MRFSAAATWVIVAATCFLLSGCCSQTSPRFATDATMFTPVAMRIHPIFSGLKDWSGDGSLDGIEALLEFEDQFGDPSKATGIVIFELFDYRKYDPDPRGDRLLNPWVASLRTIADQKAHWNRTSRTYLFQLADPAVRDDRSYTLTAMVDTGTTRFFDEVVFEGHPKPNGPATKPASQPSTQPATQPTTAPTTMSSTMPTTGPTTQSATQPAANVTTRP